MHFVNLTLPQLLTVLGAVSVGVIALYLWDRSRRRLTVPTLRFWAASQQPAEVKHRRRIQQPWSLLLQLAGLALLLLALAQLRLGSPAAMPRDHVLLLDTSAWMAARSKGHTLMELARAVARAYVRAVPAGDRVMLVRADALATPATAFETSRVPLEQAIAASQPGSTALNLGQALEFARQAQKLQGGRPGEIAYVGFGRTAEVEAVRHAPPGLRVLLVDAPVANCGLARIGARRSASDPDVWEIHAAVQNYGSAPRKMRLALAFGGSPAGVRDLALAPGAVAEAAFQYRSRVAGWLEARVLPEDDLDANHRAVIELPARSSLRVVVYTTDPELLRPVLSASPEVEPIFRSPAEYEPAPQAELMVLDRFSPPLAPERDAIWIEPPERSPVRVAAIVSDVALTGWGSDHPLAAGLRTRDLRLESAQILQPRDGDDVIAESERGPVAIARGGKIKTVVLGFHPVRTQMRYELATPLLFANILRWMRPDTFRRYELNAGSVGTVQVALDTANGEVKVLNAAGATLPHTRQGRSLRFFAGSPGTVRVATEGGETIYSLVLPELAAAKWTVPREARRGLPRAAGAGPSLTELWPWLALAGALLLLTEWLLFGRGRPVRIRASRAAVKPRPTRTAARTAGARTAV